MPWINAKAVFNISLTVFTLESTYFQYKSPFQNLKSPIYKAIYQSIPFTTLSFLFKSQVTYLQPKSPIYTPQFSKVSQLQPTDVTKV